jgi:insulysin
MPEVEVLVTPIKSESDKKEYRLIKLENGLRALLIKAEENGVEKHAGAALTVAVGSFHEPPSIGGLAHFLEHMLFMGSEKYPDESGYADFIETNKGDNNAMTGCDNTLYFFDVFEEVFDEGMFG